MTHIHDAQGVTATHTYAVAALAEGIRNVNKFESSIDLRN